MPIRVLKKGLLACVLLALVSHLTAQESSGEEPVVPRNSMYLNLIGGDCSFVSLNYDRLFPLLPGLSVSGKLGIGYTFDARLLSISTSVGTTEPPHYLTLPHHATLIIGRSGFAYELGFGGTVLIALSGYVDENVSPGYRESLYVVYPIVGYRFQPAEPGDFFYRVYLSLAHTGIVPDDTYLFFIPLGISGGVSF